MQPLRIAHVAPVATSVPPPRSGSVQTMTSLLTEGLVARGHDVTLFAPGDSVTKARLHAMFPHGYWHDETMWPWEMYELLNLTAAVERAAEFDIIHYEAGLLPDVARVHATVAACQCRRRCTTRRSPAEVALWTTLSRGAVHRDFAGAGTTDGRAQRRGRRAARHRHRSLHLQRDSPRTTCCSWDASRQARGRCRRSRLREEPGCGCCSRPPKSSIIARPWQPLVDGKQIVYVGEVDFDTKVQLYGGARALLYPVQAGEPFGLVLAEAMACGTPVAALDRGAVREIVEDGVTGGVFDDLDGMVGGLDAVTGDSTGSACARRSRSSASASCRWSTATSSAFRAIIAQRQGR